MRFQTKAAFSLLIFQCVSSISGLKCFSCTVTVPDGATDIDLTCVNEPQNVVGKNIITCPARMKWCVIVRNDLKLTDSIVSMERNCAEKPAFLNEDIESDDQITHFRSCQTDLCNSGKGNEDPNYGDGGGSGGGGAMLVPGTSNASNLTPLRVSLITLLTAIHAFLYSSRLFNSI